MLQYLMGGEGGRRHGMVRGGGNWEGSQTAKDEYFATFGTGTMLKDYEFRR